MHTGIRLGDTGPHIGESHAVGVAYEASAQSRTLKLKPRARLPEAIVLVQGRIECTTCHSGQGFGDGRTVLPVAGSTLCFACHEM